MSTVAIEQLHQHLLSQIRGQMRSTETWMAQFEKYQDASSIRNAAMALGKLSGMYQQFAELCHATGHAVPDDVFLANAKGQENWMKIGG